MRVYEEKINRKIGGEMCGKKQTSEKTNCQEHVFHKLLAVLPE